MLEILITLIIAFILALIFGNYLYKIASCKILQNIPSMLGSIPFQRILSERKNKFDNAIVVSAGPS